MTLAGNCLVHWERQISCTWERYERHLAITTARLFLRNRQAKNVKLAKLVTYVNMKVLP